MFQRPRVRQDIGPFLFTVVVIVLAAYSFARFSPTLLGPREHVTGRSAAMPRGAVATPIPEMLHSRWIAQSAPARVRPGQTATVWVTFRNTGSAVWVRGTAAEARLGLAGSPEDVTRIHATGVASRWLLPDRPAVQDEAVVSRGGETRFTFKVKGTTPGTVRLPLRLVVDGVTWMDDEGAYVDVITLSE